MLFVIDFVEANGRMNVINGAAGYSGLQAGFLKTHKGSTSAPTLPPHPSSPISGPAPTCLSPWRE